MLSKRSLCGHAVSVRLSVCPSVCLSRSYILSKWINISSKKFNHRAAHHSSFSIPKGTAIYRRERPITRASDAGGIGRNRNSDPKSGFSACCSANTAIPARCCQYDAVKPPSVSCDTSLQAAVFVDGGKGQRNVYDKKFQRYAKDNKTVFCCTQW